MARHGVSLILLGALAIGHVVGAAGWWPLAWAGASCIAVGLAYVIRAPAIFGKRQDGSMSALSLIALWPMFALTWTTWHLARWITRESACDRLTPELIIARRLLAHEIPADVDVIVDLTAEFPGSRARSYRSLAILDGSVPHRDALARLFASLPPSKVILVHCAQGHGRTATVAACLLLHRGDASTADEAIAAVQRVRPGARLNALQRRFVETFRP